MTPQRMQVIQADELSLHVVVPENTTALLWARWSQLLYQPLTTDSNGLPVEVGLPLFPLLPSFGQMLGYTQSITGNNKAALNNAREGWGG